MSSIDSPAGLVARFLRANNFEATLHAFIAEASLAPDAGSLEKDSLTIEKILEEKKNFDVSLRFEKLGTEDDDQTWTLPSPSIPSIVTSLPASSNLLHVSVNNLRTRLSDGTAKTQLTILASMADRSLNLLSTGLEFHSLKSYPYLHDSPILSCLVLDGGRVTITTSMSGQVILHDHAIDKTLAERRDHKKYVVEAVALEVSDGAWLATAGWDAKVLLYFLEKSSAGTYATLGSPVAEIELPTNPEALAFVKPLYQSAQVLLVTRRDSASLHYYDIPPVLKGSTDQSPVRPRYLGSQSLAPLSHAWIPFSPSSISVCPTNPTLLAVATSAVPYMKLMIVHLLFPSMQAEMMPSTSERETGAKTALRERDETAILIHSSTLAPQNQYSTPKVVWRPDGTGVYINSDDGFVRGVEAKTGKVVATLKSGHDPGSKVRSIWAGWVDGTRGREEWVVSGGFDRRLIVWKSAESS